MKDSMIIELQEAADFLTTSGKRFWLNPFFFQEVSQKDVAECFGITLGAVAYRIKKLLALGLIEIAKEEVINGHLTKFYRVSSQEFIVPLEVTSSIDLKSHGISIGKAVANVVGRGWAYGMQQQTFDWAFNIRCEDKIGVCQAIVGKNQKGEYTSAKNLPNYGKYLMWDAGLSLSDDDAKELHTELADLYDKYRQKSHESETNQSFYFLNLGFVPMVPDA